MTKAVLKKIYTEAGKAGSYSSAGELWREAKRRGLPVRRKDVEDFVASYRSNTLFRRGKRKPVAIFAATINQKWQLDLGFYPAYRGFIGFLVW